MFKLFCKLFVLVSLIFQDLAENGVEIEVMHIGNQFDFSSFYRVCL